MSIETERWAAGQNPCSVVNEDGEEVCFVDGPTVSLEIDARRAKAIAVLPEALALLKKVLDDIDDPDFTRLRSGDEEKARDILRRAGVLE